MSFAKLLLTRNCNVVIADIALRPEAQAVIDEHSAKDESKPRAVFVKTDVVNWDDLTNMFDVAEKEFGEVDIVCMSRLLPKCLANSHRSVLVLECLSHTGPISSTHPAHLHQRISFTVQKAWATMPLSTSTSRILFVRLNWPSHVG